MNRINIRRIPLALWRPLAYAWVSNDRIAIWVAYWERLENYNPSFPVEVLYLEKGKIYIVDVNSGDVVQLLKSPPQALLAGKFVYGSEVKDFQR